MSPDTRTAHLVLLVAVVGVLGIFVPVLSVLQGAGGLAIVAGITLAAIVLGAVIAVAIKVHKSIRSEW